LSDPTPPRRPPRNRWRGNTFGERLVRSDAFYRLSASILRALMGTARRFGRERAERVALRLVHAIGPLTRENRMAAAAIAAAFPEWRAADPCKSQTEGRKNNRLA